MEFLYSKKLKCAPRGEEDYAMHPLGRGSVRQAHTLFLYRKIRRKNGQAGKDAWNKNKIIYWKLVAANKSLCYNFPKISYG